MVQKCLCLMLAAGALATYSWPGRFSFNDGGKVAGYWTCLWLGYGGGSVASGELVLRPAVATSPDSTHSALVRSDFRLGPVWDVSVNVTTDSQLRTAKAKRRAVSAPNPWEAAWLITNMTHDGSAGLYFILKTNGVELGAYAAGGQRFLFTSGEPRLVLGRTYKYRMLNNGEWVTVLLDGTPVAAAPVSAFADVPLGDRIGLYTEDAAVRFGAVTVSDAVDYPR